MKKFRLAALLVFFVISTAACYAMELFIGAFIDGDLAAAFGRLGVTTLFVAVEETVALLLLWLILRPLVAADLARREGRVLGQEALEAARAAVNRSGTLVWAMVAVGFLVAPILVMLLEATSGIETYSLPKAIFAYLFCASLGLTTGLQVTFAFDALLVKPVRALGIHGFSRALRGRPIYRRTLLAGFSVAFFAASALAAAGYGALASLGGDHPVSPEAYLGRALLLLALVLLWTLQCFTVYSRALSRRISRVTRQLESLVKGGEDSTSRIDLAFDDEVGRLGESVNVFIATLSGLLGKVGDLSARVLEGADSLATTATHAGSAVGELEASLALVRTAVERQSEIVGGAEGEIERMAQGMDTVAARAADQTGFVEESSAAVSEMVANVASVSRTAGMADELSRRLKASAEEGGTALRAALASIREIEASSLAVREIIGVISKIAAQTNLLAMNAAIEAAHAGAAGAGFAVVADEVRTLAESAAKSAKEIVGLIQGMNTKIENGATLADRAGDSFGHITQGVAETAELVQTIAASMGEQSEGAQEILGSVEKLTEASRVIKDLTMDLREESKTMNEAMLRIVAASNEIFEAVQEETGSTQSLGRVVALVAEEAGRNHGHAEGLEAAVGTFRAKA